MGYNIRRIWRVSSLITKKLKNRHKTKKNNRCEDVRETQWDEESTKSKNPKRYAEKKTDHFLFLKTLHLEPGSSKK